MPKLTMSLSVWLSVTQYGGWTNVRLSVTTYGEWRPGSKAFRLSVTENGGQRFGESNGLIEIGRGRSSSSEL